MKRQQQLQIEKATPCTDALDCSDIASSSNQSTAHIEKKLKNLKKKQGIHGLVGCRSKHCQEKLRAEFPHKAWTKEPVITRYWNRDDNCPSNML